MGDVESLEKQVSQLSSDVQELTKKMDLLTNKLDKKVDTLTTKIDKVDANSTILVQQSKELVAATNAARAEMVMRQSVANPSGFIGRELTTYLVNSLQKYQSTKFRTWAASKGSKVVEAAITAFVNQRVPQLNWYGASIASAADGKSYRHSAKTSFPVEINTGIPFVGKIALAKVIVETQCDVDPVTHEVSNTKVNFDSEQPHRDVFASLGEDLTAMLKPNKTLWSILSPIGRGIQKLVRFMKRETRFSIPFIILLLLTYFTPGIPPAKQIWGALKFPFWGIRILGISPLNLVLGILNGIIWGAVIWLIIRFHLIPGLGIAWRFFSTRILSPIRKKYRESMAWRGVILGGIVVILALVIVWRAGVFAPPPLRMLSASPQNGLMGKLYTAELTATGGKQPYTWTVTSGVLPTGLVLDPATGKISGDLKAAGAYNFSIKVEDNSKPKQFVNNNYRVNVVAANAMTIANTSLPAGEKGKEYNATLQAIGGAAVYTWKVPAEQIPAGLTFDGITGTLSGTPKTAGDYNLVVSVEDSSATKLTYNQSLTLHIK